MFNLVRGVLNYNAITNGLDLSAAVERGIADWLRGAVDWDAASIQWYVRDFAWAEEALRRELTSPEVIPERRALAIRWLLELE